MEKSKNKTVRGREFAYLCKVCGKEGYDRNIKDHIEANHLEGIILPCNLCDKTFRSRNGLRQHKRQHHEMLWGTTKGRNTLAFRIYLEYFQHTTSPQNAQQKISHWPSLINIRINTVILFDIFAAYRIDEHVKVLMRISRIQRQISHCWWICAPSIFQFMWTTFCTVNKCGDSPQCE